METLRKLHRLHQQLSDIEDRLSRGPKQIKARRIQLTKLEEDLQQSRNEAKLAQMAADKKELQLKTNEAKIEDLKVKLNAVKNNREYQAIREQILADQMACSVLSDEILDAIDKVEAAKQKLPEKEKLVEDAKADLDNLQSTISEKQQGMEQDLSRIKNELEETEAQLPADTQETYRRSVRSKGPEALASVEMETCQGCFHKLTTNMFVSLKMDKFITCRNCGRILYLPESAG